MNERVESGLEPSEEISEPVTFADAIPLFPEEEQPQAEYYSGIRQRYMALAKSDIMNGDMTTYDLLTNYYKQRGSKIEDCKLYHLFAGSSMTAEEWRGLPLDTPNEDWRQFTENSIVPLLEKKESEEAK